MTVQDQNGNTVTGDASNVTLAITSGTGTSGATLACTANPATASSGVATFAGCKIDKSGTGYTLTATDGSLTSATSSSVTISVGAAAQLAFTQQPNGAVAATAFVTQPKVAIEDAGGNVVTTNTSSVTVAIGTNPSSGTLTCTTNPRAAVAGVASLAGCKISAGGAGYTLTATDGVLTSATSSSFSVYAYAAVAGNQATSGTTVTTNSFTLAANTTYLVFASNNSGATGDSATVTASGFTSAPTVNAIGNASYDNAAIEWGGYLVNGSGTGTLTVTFAKTIKQAYFEVIAVTGADTSSPVAQSAFAKMTGTTASNPATANLSSAPDPVERRADLLEQRAERDRGVVMVFLLGAHRRNEHERRRHQRLGRDVRRRAGSADRVPEHGLEQDLGDGRGRAQLGVTASSARSALRSTLPTLVSGTASMTCDLAGVLVAADPVARPLDQLLGGELGAGAERHERHDLLAVPPGRAGRRPPALSIAGCSSSASSTSRG